MPSSPSIPSLENLSALFDIRKDGASKPANYQTSIYFEFASDLVNGTRDAGPQRQQQRQRQQQWAAALWVYTSDVPRLMREGFGCTEANVVSAHSYVVADCTWKAKFASSLPHSGQFAMRRYLLIDRLEKEECPRWTACLFVSASNNRLDVLSRFSVADLQAGAVDVCQAFNPRGKEVYFYSHRSPLRRINCLYSEDVALEGLWPWPKKVAKKETTEGDEAKDAEMPGVAEELADTPQPAEQGGQRDADSDVSDTRTETSSVFLFVD